jgi:SWI/SNF-related matrix-associated actin-dependent regulator of chromatin subfamily A-like protein 1
MRDMWNVVNTISPGRFGDKFFSFGLRYCDGHQEDIKFNAGGAKTTKTVWNFDGKSNEEELAKRLSFFMLRRTKSDVMKELPAKTRQAIWVDVKSAKKRAYIPDAENRAAMRTALDKSADAKLPQASQVILDHLAAGKKVVAFTWRKHVAEGLAGDASEAGFVAGVGHGGIPALTRQKTFDALSKETGAALLAATIDSAGVGIDLAWADVIVFVELVWEPHKLLQAEARGFSLTNTRGLFIQYILARGTADELVSSVVLDKLDLFESVVGSADAGNVRRDIQEADEDVMKELYKMMGGI